jgi:hypothetical protein
MDWGIGHFLARTGLNRPRDRNSSGPQVDPADVTPATPERKADSIKFHLFQPIPPESDSQAKEDIDALPALTNNKNASVRQGWIVPDEAMHIQRRAARVAGPA